MNDLNLKNLIPKKDSEYWEPLVGRILKQTVYAQESTETIWYQIFNWWKPVLVAASLTTVLVWTLAFSNSAQSVITGSESQVKSEVRSTTDRMISLAVHTDSPSASQLYRLLGDIEQ